MWNKLFKRELIFSDKGILKFDESLKLGGDVLYLAQLATSANKTKYIDSPFYHYRIRINSGSHSTDLERRKDWIRAYELTINHLEKNNVDKEIVDYAIRFMAYHAFEGASIAIELNNENSKKYFQEIMKRNAEIYIKLNSKYRNRIDRYNEIMRQ